MSDSLKFEVTAPIHHICAVQQVTEKFRKRECVLLLDADSKYPQTVPMTFTGDRCDRLDDFRPGEVVKVTFNLRGREHKGKFYGEFAAFKIDLVGERSAAPPNTRSPEPEEAPIPF